MRLHKCLMRGVVVDCAVITVMLAWVVQTSGAREPVRAVENVFSAGLALAEAPECGRAILALDPVPAPAAPPEVPVLRHERRLRFLAMIHLRDADYAAPYQRIARRCGASLELLVTATSDSSTDFVLGHTLDTPSPYASGTAYYTARDADVKKCSGQVQGKRKVDGR